MLQNLLKQTATIEREYIALASAPTSFIYVKGEIAHSLTLQNAQGQPVVDWQDLSTSNPCRLEDIDSTEIVDGKQLIITRTLCYMNNVDVTETDRVVVGATTYIIDSVLRAPGMDSIDHLELKLTQKNKV